MTTSDHIFDVSIVDSLHPMKVAKLEENVKFLGDWYSSTAIVTNMTKGVALSQHKRVLRLRENMTTTIQSIEPTKGILSRCTFDIK